MSFDMFSGKQSDDMDPNYIYPHPYIDPMMYANSYWMSSNMSMDPNMNMGGYITYMNPYVNNPYMNMAQNFNGSNNSEQEGQPEDNSMEQYTSNMMPSMPGMPNMMFPPGMMPGMSNGMPNMMFPYMMMPGMMFPYMMMPGMSPINMEEFDEEEM